MIELIIFMIRNLTEQDGKQGKKNILPPHPPFNQMHYFDILIRQW